jgi:hypothetical protein
MNLVPSNGRLIVGVDSPVVREVFDEMHGKLHTNIETFGTSDDAKWQARYIDFSGETTRFTVFKDGHSWGEFETNLIGEFNVRNCLAVIIAADAWGISRKKSGSFPHFQIVKRRVEVRGVERGVTVIDDFAHHPTAVEETLKALKTKYDGKRLIAVFEPRSWSSRLAVFQEPYAKRLPTPITSSSPEFTTLQSESELGKVLDVDELVEDIKLQGKPAMSFPDADAIVEHLAPELKENDVVAIMSNGGFGGIHEKILDVLKSNENDFSFSRSQRIWRLILVCVIFLLHDIFKSRRHLFDRRLRIFVFQTIERRFAFLFGFARVNGDKIPNQHLFAVGAPASVEIIADRRHIRTAVISENFARRLFFLFVFAVGFERFNIFAAVAVFVGFISFDNYRVKRGRLIRLVCP